MKSTLSQPGRLARLAHERLAFGPRPGNSESLGRQGFRELVEEQLHPHQVEDRECARLLLRFKTLRLPLQRLWSLYFQDLARSDQPLREVVAATFVRAVHSRRQLQELLTDFWHNQFSVYGRQEEVAPLFPHYDGDVIRPHVLGNFRELLRAVASSPVMLFFVSRSGSQARLLTEHSGTSRFVCRQLCRRLVADEPPAPLLERITRVFNASCREPDQLRRVVREIVLSREFSESAGGKLKRPFDFAVSLLRRLDARLDQLGPFLQAYDLLGQPLFGRQAPDGFPDRHADWNHATAMHGRFQLAQALLAGEFPGVRLNLGGRSAQQWFELATSPDFQQR